MKTLFAVVSTAIMLASCVPSTPQARIAQSPQMFTNLSSKHKALVEQGQISRGMTPDAVYLAWGTPSNTLLGSFKGQESELWDYVASRPVYTSNFFGGFGHGGYRGNHGRGYGRYSAVGFGLGPEISYVPSRMATVWFLSHRVDSWERQR